MPLSLAERRLARLAKHVNESQPPELEPTPPIPPVERQEPECPMEDDLASLAEPIIAMLEAPAEDAMSRTAVERSFAQHQLKVVWALEENGWQEALQAHVLVTVKRRVDEALLATLPHLKLVAVAFTGYDHIDLEACRRRRVAVANVPGYATDSAAEHCFGLIFALLRHLPMAHQHVRMGRWVWPPGNELAGQRLGLIGTGDLGLRVAEIGKAFRVSKIIGFDPVKNPKFERVGGQYVPSLATVFLHADIVVVACSLTAQTERLVGERILRLLRPTSLLINCARGAIVDQQALTRMLTERRFRAGLDVFEVEPLPSDHPLRTVPESHLVCTPHLAYKCHESLLRRQELVLDNILAFLAGSPQNIIC